MLLLIIVIILNVLFLPCATHPDATNQSKNSTFSCRSERRVYIPYGEFKADVCARCYRYMPTYAFKLKFRYVGYNGVLLDPRTNISHTPDPFNSSSALLDSFLDKNLANKWKACCQAAWECCEGMTKGPQVPVDGTHCPRTWDGWQCWPDTMAGTTAKQPCQDHIYFQTSPPPCTRFAYKQCLPNGTWYLNEHFREWTNYSKCGRRDENRRYLHFHIATYVISIVTIVPALMIFRSYKQLNVHRIAMHKNLFLSLLLNAIAVVFFKSLVILQELSRDSHAHPSVLDSNGSGCKILLVLTKYFRMTNYMWMFCEGYYLHKLIAAAFAEQKTLLMFYVAGWGLPIIPVSAYAILRATLENEKCWAFPVERYEWIMNVPNLLSLIVNLFFLCNIIRILVTKLRATHANEPNQYRKAVRATLVLVPLFGLHFCLVIYRPYSGKCGFLEAYVYFNYAMDGLQGFMVALIFCYMNGEVLYLLKRSYQRFKLHLQIQGSMHSSAILRRLSTTQDSTMNDSQNHHSQRTKYMENKLRELNNQISTNNIANDNCNRQKIHFNV